MDTLNQTRSATRSSFGEGAGTDVQRPLAMLASRVARATNQLDEQTSMLADAKMHTLNRMIGEPGVEPAEARKDDPPVRQLHFGGDIAELEEMVMRLELTVNTVVDRERYVTNRLTNIG